MFILEQDRKEEITELKYYTSEFQFFSFPWQSGKILDFENWLKPLQASYNTGSTRRNKSMQVS